MHNATPTLAEPLEAVIPRLTASMESIIAALRASGVSVGTSSSFLLDLTQWPFQVPNALDGIPIQMGFAGSIPGWDDKIRYHLQVHLVGDRRWTMCEPPKGFNVPRIVDRILGQLESVKRERAKREQSERNRLLAEERLAQLAAATNLMQESPLRLKQDNIRAEGLSEAPDEVQVTVRTSHANAESIIREFRVSSRRPRKLEDR